MSEKRILIPREDIWTNPDENEYSRVLNNYTRSITPDDIRSGVRDSSEQFSDAEKQEIWETMTNEHLVKSGRIMATIRKVLDIATRPAPEPDPWEEGDA